MFHPSRGGVRGGKDQFNWDDVKGDKHRENYLGHSLMAPVGRWQKGKDLTWYAKDGKDDSKTKANAAELAKIKEAEAEAMAIALGVRKKKTLESNVTQDDLKHALNRDNDSDVDEQADLDASEKGLGYGKASRLQGATSSNAVPLLNNARSFAPAPVIKSEDHDDEHKKKKKHKKHHKHKSEKKRRRHYSDEESEQEDRSKHRRRHDESPERRSRYRSPEEHRRRRSPETSRRHASPMSRRYRSPEKRRRRRSSDRRRRDSSVDRYGSPVNRHRVKQESISPKREIMSPRRRVSMSPRRRESMSPRRKDIMDDDKYSFKRELRPACNYNDRPSPKRSRSRSLSPFSKRQLLSK